jgi:type VI secretion system protein ImpE
MVWTPAYLTYANGGEVVAVIPSRYPATHDSGDAQLLLSRKTEWREIGTDRWAGLGQRVFSSNLGDHDLLAVHLIELQPPPEEGDEGGDGGDANEGGHG